MAINSSAWHGRAVALLPSPARPIPSPNSLPLRLLLGPTRTERPTETTTWDAAKKVVAYAVLGFVCPFRDVTKPETTDPTSRLLVGEGERWDGWARQRLASPRIATSPSLRVTFEKCSLPRVRATLHEARGSRDPRAAAANHRNREIFPHKSVYAPEPSFYGASRDMPTQAQTRQDGNPV